MRYIRLLISIAIIDKHKKIEVFNASIFVTAESEGLSQVNHKYPVFSYANIGIKPTYLSLF